MKAKKTFRYESTPSLFAKCWKIFERFKVVWIAMPFPPHEYNANQSKDFKLLQYKIRELTLPLLMSCFLENVVKFHMRFKEYSRDFKYAIQIKSKISTFLAFLPLHVKSRTFSVMKHIRFFCKMS